jgi:hypothetical protein
LNLFLLSAPYQLLNAIECINRFGWTENRLVIVDTGHFTRKRFEKVIDPGIWGGVEYLDLRYKFADYEFGRGRRTLKEYAMERLLTLDQMAKRHRASKFCRACGPVDALVLGNYLADYDLHMRHFANHLRYRQLYLVDVGTDTLRIARQRAEEVERGLRAGSRWAQSQEGWRKRVRRRLVDWDSAGVRKLTFFSAYDVQVSGEDQLIANRYAHARAMVPTTGRGDTIYFVGQSLIDQGYLSAETFFAAIAAVKRFFADKRVVYYMHPRESEQQVAIVRSSGIEVRENEVPFEHLLCFSEERPTCIAAFFSSVVENCAVIFGSAIRIITFQLDESALKKDHENTRKIYEQFRANRFGNIEVVPLNLTTFQSCAERKGRTLETRGCPSNPSAAYRTSF